MTIQKEMRRASLFKMEANTDVQQKKSKKTLQSLVWPAGASRAGCKQTNLQFSPQLATMLPLVQIANGHKSFGRDYILSLGVLGSNHCSRPLIQQLPPTHHLTNLLLPKKRELWELWEEPPGAMLREIFVEAQMHCFSAPSLSSSSSASL